MYCHGCVSFFDHLTFLYAFWALLWFFITVTLAVYILTGLKKFTLRILSVVNRAFKVGTVCLSLIVWSYLIKHLIIFKERGYTSLNLRRELLKSSHWRYTGTVLTVVVYCGCGSPIWQLKLLIPHLKSSSFL